LEPPQLALEDLMGLIVIDEIQVMPFTDVTEAWNYE